MNAEERCEKLVDRIKLISKGSGQGSSMNTSECMPAVFWPKLYLIEMIKEAETAVRADEQALVEKKERYRMKVERKLTKILIIGLFVACLIGLIVKILPIIIVPS